MNNSTMNSDGGWTEKNSGKALIRFLAGNKLSTLLSAAAKWVSNSSVLSSIGALVVREIINS